MPRTVQARLDADSERDLAILRNEADRTDSEAIRLALREAADRRRSRAALRAEAERAAKDPADLEEIRRVRQFMDSIAVIWDEDRAEEEG